MTELNLCEILKGHEGETFYSPMCGKISFCCIDRDSSYPIKCIRGYKEINFTDKGEYFKDDYGECLIFPSKDQRDWNKWLEEQKPKVPKTWNELCEAAQVQQYEAITDVIFDDNDKMIDESSAVGENIKLAKSALALLKIHQLIEVGYGGNPSTKEKINRDNSLYEISIDSDGELTVEYLALPTNHIAFRTKEQAEEFLSYLENIQLLKDYFMIN